MDLCTSKAIHVFLILFCCFSGTASKNGEEDVCSNFPGPRKGKRVFCKDDYMPICGTNNVTYTNLCLFCEARSDDLYLEVKHKGQCKEKVQWPSQQDICSPFQDFAGCRRIYDPLCGNDGVTYSDICDFCEARRESGILQILHKGECEVKDECSKFKVQLGGLPNQCTFESDPLCGSDGVTYPNKCAFCIGKRLSGNFIVIVHQGPCEQDESLCGTNSICLKIV